MSSKKEIAEVNGEYIYEWQLFDTMQSYAKEVLKKDLSSLTPQEYNESKEEALEKLIASELLIAEAISSGFTIEDEEVDKAIEEFKNQLSNDYSLGDYLADRNITIEEFKNLLRKQLIKENFVSKIISKIPIPTNKDVESYYEKVKEKLCYPPTFEFFVCYISNPTEDEKEKFKTLFMNIANKKMEKNFAETIMKSSSDLCENIKFKHFDETSDNLPKEIIDLLIKLENLTFSPIYEAENELSIFYLINKEINKRLPENMGKEEAKKYLSIVRVKKILDAYIDMLKDKYTIKVFIHD